MRRIKLILKVAAAMAMMLAMLAGPALAQDWSSPWNNWSPWWRHHDRFDNGVVGGPNFDDQRLESGDIENNADISIEGNNNTQCAGLLQSNNTGNFANQQGTSQFGNGDGRDFRFHRFPGNGDNEFAGPETTFAPENETACDQQVQQAAAASSTWDW